jgi:hypothetical protein
MESVSEDKSLNPEIGFAYGMDRYKTCVEISIQRLKLVNLIISKVMIDLVENSGNNKLQFENARVLQDISVDINDIVNFINLELINKK